MAEAIATMQHNRRPLFTLYGTTLVSVTGNAMAAIAIPWFVLQTTGSAAQTGITAFFTVMPIVIGMFFGGALVDRIGYKRVSVGADLVSGAATLLIPLLYYTTGLAFWQLLALVFIGNLFDSPGRSARSAMLPELSAAAGIDLDRSNGLMESISRATGMIGAPVAGLLVATLGVAGVLLIDAVTFFISAVGTQALIPASLVEAEHHEKTPYLDDLRAGFQFVRTDSLIITIIAVVMVTNMIDAAMGAVTLPVYAQTMFGAEQGALAQGLMIGAFGAAALVGSLLYSGSGRIFSRRWLFTLGFMVVGLRFLVFAAFPSLGVLMVAMLVNGLLAGPINPIIGTAMYQRIPREMRARVFGLLSAGVLVATPIGGLLAGFLTQQSGLRETLLIYAAIYIVATGSLLFNRSVRQLDGAKEAAEL